VTFSPHWVPTLAPPLRGLKPNEPRPAPACPSVPALAPPTSKRRSTPVANWVIESSSRGRGHYGATESRRERGWRVAANRSVDQRDGAGGWLGAGEDSGVLEGAAALSRRSIPLSRRTPAVPDPRATLACAGRAAAYSSRNSALRLHVLHCISPRKRRDEGQGVED